MHLKRNASLAMEMFQIINIDWKGNTAMKGNTDTGLSA